MARTYKRDSRGRFAGGGGSSSRGGGRKPIQRGTNRLTRDNSGRITSVGGDGATARGGRLRTASGKQRATVTAKGIGKAPAGTVTRSGARRTAAAAAAAKPAATKLQRSGRKSRIENLSTNQEMGRKGIVSMSPRAKSVRSAAVAERKAERVSRIAERQTGIVARRQINRASNYNPDGTFNQSAANANQRRLKRSQQLQEKLRTAGTGASIASNALSKRRSTNPTTRAAAAAVKPVKAAQASKAERILNRVNENAQRSAKGTNAKSARSAAVALMARATLSSRAVGKRDPNQQYPRADLLARLNRSVSRPTPKAERSYTGKKGKKSEKRLERDAAAALIRFNRKKASSR